MSPPNKSKPNHNGRRFAPKPKPLTHQEAVPTLTFDPSNNWIVFSKRMALAVGDRFGRLADIVDHGAYYVPPLPAPDMTIVDSAMRDEVLKSDYRERSKLIIKQEADKPMLYAFILTKLSLESEDEVKRHPNYNNFHFTKDPLELWKALLQLHLTNTISKNADFVLQAAENDYMTCNQGEFESLTKFKERFDIKLKASINALDPTLQVSDKRAAMAFLKKLHRTPYGQFYANKINIINTDATKVPANVNEVYVEAKAYITIVTTNKPNGTPVSFATTAESFLRSNKKKTPRGNNNNANYPNNGLYVPPSTTTTLHVTTVADCHDQASGQVPNQSPNNSPTLRDMSRIQCYNCQVFGHYARDRPTKDPLTVMTTGGKSYYQPQWYEVGLDTLSQVNVLNSRFLENIVPGQSSFKGLCYVIPRDHGHIPRPQMPSV